jgi:hypothetical protein
MSLPAVRIRTTSMNPIMTKGSVLPRMSSQGLMGETMSCSNVPISLSLVMAMDVRVSVVIRRIIQMTPGTK